MTNSAYGMRALAAELDKLGRAQPGERNTTLNTVWLKLCQHINAGNLDYDHAWQLTYDTARQIGLDDTEIRKTMASAEKGAATHPRTMPTPHQPPTEFVTPSEDPSTEPSPEHTFLPDTFWDEREPLRQIRQAAWSRGRSAEAVLGTVLARIAADTTHLIKLPAIVGTEIGLSLIVALTGPPGTGKSSAKAIAMRLVPATLIHTECDDIPPGSGEGLLEIMFEYEMEETPDGKTRKVKRLTRHNAFAYADEGEILAIQARRNTNNTILPIIRSVFTDATLGQVNATEERRRRIPAGTYTFGIVLGIQPGKIGPLLDDAGGGTPQRFLWAPTDTPTPEPETRPHWDGTTLKRPHTLPYDDHRDRQTGHYLIDIPTDIKTEIVTADHHRQQHGCNPLDEHADLIQLKVAAILAILDGRLNINPTDWQLADAIRTLSTNTRTRAINAVAHNQHETNRRRGESESERQQIIDTNRDDHILNRARTGILRKLDIANGNWVNHNTIRSSLRSTIRDDFEPAMDRLIEASVVQVENRSGQWGDATWYRKRT